MNLETYMEEEASIAAKKEKRFRELCDSGVVKPTGVLNPSTATTILPHECPYCGDFKHPCRCYEFGGM